jgi:hypothetical protein
MAVRAAWGDFPEELLLPALESAFVLPCENGHACQRVVVEHGPGDAVGICQQMPPHCEARPVRKDERAVYRLDEKKLFGRIQKLVGITGTPEQMPAEAWFWRIGSIPVNGDRSLPAFFTFARNVSAVDVAIGRLVMTYRECFLLIVSDGMLIREAHRATAQACGSVIVALDDLFDIGVDGRISSRTAGPEAVLAWQNEVAPAAGTLESKFPTPPETTWKDVNITFKSRDIISVKCRTVAAVNIERTHIPGMFDSTSGEKNPTDKWYLLMAFAARGPTLGMDELTRLFGSRNWPMMRKQKSDLSKALRAYFQIEADPLPLNKRTNRYEPIVVIRQDTNTDLEVWLRDFKG